MDEKIYLTLLLYKDIVSDKHSLQKHLHYRVLGPMMGTVEEDVFINTSDREYYSIEDSFVNMNDDIRYVYYLLLSLKDAKEKYQTDDLEKVVECFYKEHEKDTYYVICIENKDPIIIRYDENRMHRKMESDLVTPL